MAVAVLQGAISLKELRCESDRFLEDEDEVEK